MLVLQRPVATPSPRARYALAMTDRTTFADLDARKLELLVTCERCGHRVVVDGARPELRNQPIASQRFRCHAFVDGLKCGGLGLPMLGPRSDWTSQAPPAPPPLRCPPPATPASSAGMAQSIDPRSEFGKRWMRSISEASPKCRRISGRADSFLLLVLPYQLGGGDEWARRETMPTWWTRNELQRQRSAE
jgi:hypothetical protein